MDKYYVIIAGYYGMERSKADAGSLAGYIEEVDSLEEAKKLCRCADTQIIKGELIERKA